jgi:hypothetical protein
VHNDSSLSIPALVVGLLPGQATRVRRALGHRFKFRFVTSEHARSLRRTYPVNVVLLDYVDHTATARLDRLLQPGQTLIRVRGLDKNVITQLGNHQ